MHAGTYLTKHKTHACVLSSFSHVQLFVPMSCIPPGSPVYGFSRQEYWSELSFPTPGNLLDSAIELTSPVAPALQADSLPSEYQGSTFYFNSRKYKMQWCVFWGFPWWLSSKESACNAGATGDADSIPRPGRSPEEGHGNPLHYSCLENPMDRGAWQATIRGVTKRWTQLNDWTQHHHKVYINHRSAWFCSLQTWLTQSNTTI